MDMLWSRRMIQIFVMEYFLQNSNCKYIMRRIVTIAILEDQLPQGKSVYTLSRATSEQDDFSVLHFDNTDCLVSYLKVNSKDKELLPDCIVVDASLDYDYGTWGFLESYEAFAQQLVSRPKIFLMTNSPLLSIKASPRVTRYDFILDIFSKPMRERTWSRVLEVYGINRFTVGLTKSW
jgi:hypothetical protein